MFLGGMVFILSVIKTCGGGMDYWLQCKDLFLFDPPQEHTSHEGNQKGINFFLEFPIFDLSKVGIHMRGGVGKSFKPQPPLEDPQIAKAPRFPSIPGPKVNRTEANPIREADLRWFFWKPKLRWKLRSGSWSRSKINPAKRCPFFCRVTFEKMNPPLILSWSSTNPLTILPLEDWRRILGGLMEDLGRIKSRCESSTDRKEISILHWSSTWRIGRGSQEDPN